MKKQTAAISVITIVKNNEQLLPRAISSMLAQTFSGFEYLIVNDGSTDGTTAIIDDYANNDSRITPIHLQENIGRSMARNTGLDAATGEYVFFLDSDDYLPDNALADLFEIAEKYNSDIVFGSVTSFDNDTGERQDSHYTDSIFNCNRHNFRLEDHLALVDNHQIIGQLYRRAMLSDNNIRFSTTRKNGEDVLFSFYTVFHAKRLSILASKKTYFYNAGNYLGTANESKLNDARDNVLETIRFAEENGSPALQRMMWRKGVLFSGNLTRAEKAFSGNEEKFLDYISTLVPLVEGADDVILDSTWPYCNAIARLLLVHDFDEINVMWKWHQTMTHEIRGLESRLQDTCEEVKLLAHQLDDLYSSTSWRLTAPIRAAIGKLKKVSSGQKNAALPERPDLKSTVSVIIPVYKVEPFLTQCLDSVVEQTLQGIEIICINDCSPDGSQSILNEFASKDARFLLLQHEENKGLAAARNTGLDAAAGDYIYFLDSDDYLARNDALEILLLTAQLDDADEVIGGIVKWHEDTGERYPDWHRNYLEREVHGKSLEDLPQLKANVIAPNKLIRKAMLDAQNIRFRPELRKHEDNPFSCKAHILARRISIIPVTTYIYRQGRNESIMANDTRQDAGFRCMYCADIFAFLESDEAYHPYRSMYYPGYAWQLIKGAEILSRFTPSPDEILDLMQCWSVAIEPMSAGFPEVPDKLSEIFLMVRKGQFNEAWEKALAEHPNRTPSHPVTSRHVSSLNQWLRTLESRTEKQETGKKRITSQIQAVRASTSWRLTGVLRSVFRMDEGL